MELKQVSIARKGTVIILLIVPYGIETLSARVRRPQRSELLIVPYGIETTERHGRTDTRTNF